MSELYLFDTNILVHLVRDVRPIHRPFPQGGQASPLRAGKAAEGFFDSPFERAYAAAWSLMPSG